MGLTTRLTMFIVLFEALLSVHAPDYNIQILVDYQRIYVKLSTTSSVHFICCHE